MEMMMMMTRATPANTPAETTDMQIAVRAAQAYYPHGAPPKVCTALVGTIEYLDSMPRGAWPQTEQAWRQARERYNDLSQSIVDRVMYRLRSMRAARAWAQHDARVSAATSIVQRAGLTALVDRLVELQRTTDPEFPANDDWYTDVVVRANPQIPRHVAAAVSLLAVETVLRSDRAYARRADLGDEG